MKCLVDVSVQVAMNLIDWMGKESKDVYDRFNFYMFQKNY